MKEGGREREVTRLPLALVTGGCKVRRICYLRTWLSAVDVVD